MRRSSRLSGYDGGGGAAMSSSSRPSTSSDATSPGALPTIAHARARAKAAATGAGAGTSSRGRDHDDNHIGRERVERRFEDFMDEDATTAASGSAPGEMTTFFREPMESRKRHHRASSSSPQRHGEPDDIYVRARAVRDAGQLRNGAGSSSRKPRKSTLAFLECSKKVVAKTSVSAYNEQVDESGFIFTSERPRDPSSSSSTAAPRGVPGSMGPPPTASYRTMYEPLADVGIGETPVHRRNQAFRARGGLDNADNQSTPLGNVMSSARRSSIGTKSNRRVSSLTSGAPAYPHPRVPDKEMYRHCSNEIGDVGRMKHLAGWALKRAVDSTLQGETRKNRRGESQKYLSSRELRELERCKDVVKSAMDAMLADLNRGLVNVSWLGRQKISSSVQKKPHPRNIANTSSSERLSSHLESLTREVEAWRTEEAKLDAFEEETRRLVEEARISLALEGPDDVTLPSGGAESELLEWADTDLSEVQLEQLQEARRALAYEAPWAAGDGGTRGDAAVRAASLSLGTRASHFSSRKDGKRRASDGADRGLIEEAYRGTELDDRWSDVEFHADLLRSQTHRYTQLSSLADRYLSEVSARATRALRDLADGTVRSASSSGAASGSSASRRQVGSQRAIASRLARESRDNVETILTRMRDLSKGERVEEAEEERGDENINVGDRSEGDLLRALASS